MVEPSKNLATKTQKETPLDSGEKNREKKIQMFDLRYFIGKSYSNKERSKYYLKFHIKFLNRYLKGCEKKVSQLLLHHTIVLLQTNSKIAIKF